MPILAAVILLAVAVPPGLSPEDARYLEAPDREPPFDMPAFEPPVFPDRDFPITDYGAVEGGSVKNTEAIARAIAACHDAGGGRVVVPEGVWLTGAVHLKSGVNLHLAAGATLRFSDDPRDYLPPVFVRWAGFELYNYSPLIYAADCENIAVTGTGTLDGQGRRWWPWLRRQNEVTDRIYRQVKDGVPPEERVYGTEEWPLRPQFLVPINCRNVLLEDFTITSGPFWTVHLTYCENVLVQRLNVQTSGPNSDGVNADSCRNVIIQDCRFSTYDDSVAIKSGMNEDGRRVGRPSENIIVRRCLAEQGMTGVAIGSDMSGDVRNVYVHDCIFRGLWMGVWIKSTRGRGGVVENVWYENLLINRVSYHAVGITTAYQAFLATTEGEAPIIRNIHYRNLCAPYVIRAIDLAGLPDVPLRNIRFDDSDLCGAYTARVADVEGLALNNTVLQSLQDDATAQLTNCRDVVVLGAEIPPGSKVFLEVSGERSESIRVENVRIPEGMEPIRLGEGANAEAVAGTSQP